MRFLHSFVFVFAVCSALSALAAPPPGYYEVWGDEFNGTSLDPTKWNVWNQPDRSGYSTPAAVTESNGYMTITTYTEDGTNYCGIVTSDPFFRERFGYTEASVEFNSSPGMFTDFWMQSAVNGLIDNDPAASGAELDFCEHRETDANDADNISGQVTVDLDWNGYTTGIKTTASSGLIGSGLGTGFHIYGGLWTPSNYTVSFDGTNAWSTNVGVSAHSEVIMFSTEVDSNSFCGIVPAGGYGSFNVSTTTTVVDYLRYYAPTTTLYFTGASSPYLTDSNNYVSNMPPTPASDLVFGYLTVGNYNINVPAPTTVDSLSIEETPALNISGAALTVNAGGIDLLSALADSTIACPLVLSANQAWTIQTNIGLIVTGPMSGPGGLTLTQWGVLALEDTNNCTGVTTVSNGMLQDYGVMNGPVTVAGGTLTGTGALNGAVTVNGGILTGTETITSPVTVSSGGTIEPGSPYGTMAISNSLTLQSGSAFLANVNAFNGSSGQIAGLTSIALGGTLIVSNLGGTLAAGDSFTIFTAASSSGAFSRITPASPGPGLAWDTTSLSSGVLQIVSTNGSYLTAQLTGSQQVTVSWLAANIGWLLQSQTNPPGTGITTNWVTIPGSSVTNFMTFTINPSVGSVFFRLAAPSVSTSIFGAGDLVVLQVGNGSISSSGAPGVLKDFSTNGGSSVIQINLPTNGSSSLIFGGSAYEGGVVLSADGHSLVVGGYNVALGSFSGTIDSSSTTGGSAVPRAIGSISASGTFTIAATTTQFSGSTIRSAVADGNGNFWAGGGASGVVYLGSNSPAAVISTVSTSTRNLGIFNGNLYFTETGSGDGIMAFNGTPTSASTPSLIVNTAGIGTPSPEGFAINPSATIAYVTDNNANTSGGGIQRFNWNGSAWVYAYTLVQTVTSSDEVWDMIANFNGPYPVLYAITGETTGNHIVTVTDTGSSSTFSKVAGASSGDAYRGLAFAPTSP